jgi:two-component system, OmpR family, response regulator PhoP
MTDYRPPPSYPSPRTLRVFVLEDDLELRQHLLLPALRDHGFRAEGAATAAELYRTLHTQRFDLLILDIGLPDEDGITVAKHLRPRSDMGIVMLSGHSERQLHLDALHSGADSFLAKPVDVGLLIATVHAVARRVSSQGGIKEAASAVTPTSRWQLTDHDWLLVSPHGETVTLTPTERYVAIALATGNNSPVSRDQLMRALPCDIHDFDPHRIDAIIYRLRRKVYEITGTTLPLFTVRGSGYRFACDRV